MGRQSRHPVRHLRVGVRSSWIKNRLRLENRRLHFGELIFDCSEGLTRPTSSSALLPWTLCLDQLYSLLPGPVNSIRPIGSSRFAWSEATLSSTDIPTGELASSG